jgi:hypothetical protein
MKSIPCMGEGAMRDQDLAERHWRILILADKEINGIIGNILMLNQG